MSHDVITTQPTWTNETVNDVITAVSHENEHNDLLHENAVDDNARKEEEKKKQSTVYYNVAGTADFTPVNNNDPVEDMVCNYLLCRWLTDCCVSCCQDQEGFSCSCCKSGEHTGDGGAGDCCGDGDCDCDDCDCDCGDCDCGDCNCDCGDCSCFD